MGSKKYKGKPCVYCGSGVSSTTGDHVFARQFVGESHRHDLPKVPCCIECNNEKSKLEHYLTTLLPFGGRHEEALEALRAAEPRLQNNKKLHKIVQSGLTEVHGAFVEKLGKPSPAIPFESEKLVSLAIYIARGMFYYHWGIGFDAEQGVNGICASQEGDALLLEHFIAHFSANKSCNSIGHGALEYQVIKSPIEPWISIWRFSFFNGARIGDSKGRFSDYIWVFIGPKHLSEDFFQPPDM